MRTRCLAIDAIARNTRRPLRAPWPRPRFAWAGFLCAAALLTGCAAPLNRATGGLIPAEHWPPRITAGLKALAASTPTGLDAKPGHGARSNHADDRQQTPQRLDPVIRCAPHGSGLVLELTPDAADATAQPPVTRLAFISFSSLDPEGRPLPPAQAVLPDAITPTELRAAVHWRLDEPVQQQPRGLIVHLGGNKYVRRALLARGWAVLTSAGTGRYSHRRVSPTVFEVDRTGEVEAAAARLAATIDDELADWPYSLEAVLAYLGRHRPDIPQKPLAVMGFSIGALGLPAVVARMPERFEAAVIVAGGANLLEISQRTTKPDSGIALQWNGGKPSEEDWQRLSAAYLAHVKLDPYHTAVALTDLPVLVFHGHLDRVVPAGQGELLHRRLGKPQRFAYPVGHRQLLRLVMRLESGRIVEWIEQAISDEGERESSRESDRNRSSGTTICGRPLA